MIYIAIGITRECANDNDIVKAITQKLTSYVLSEATVFGLKLNPEQIIDIIEMDMQINAQGLAFWLSLKS